MRGHLRDEADRRRAAQDARRDAAAERRVGWHFATPMTSTHAFAPIFSLVASPRPEAAARVTCVRRFFCRPERASAVCEC